MQQKKPIKRNEQIVKLVSPSFYIIVLLENKKWSKVWGSTNTHH